jgi:hypothetical protein
MSSCADAAQARQTLQSPSAVVHAIAQQIVKEDALVQRHRGTLLLAVAIDSNSRTESAIDRFSLRPLRCSRRRSARFVMFRSADMTHAAPRDRGLSRDPRRLERNAGPASTEAGNDCGGADDHPTGVLPNRRKWAVPDEQRGRSKRCPESGARYYPVAGSRRGHTGAHRHHVGGFVSARGHHNFNELDAWSSLP